MSGERRCIACDAAGPFKRVFKRGPYTLVRCRRCRLVFQHPQPPDADIAASYYHDPAFTEALFGPLRELTLARARERLALLVGLGVAGGGRALDVGCSSGAWLEVAREAGWDGVGVELGASTAARARERGLDVRTGTLVSALPGLAGERFDLIAFWDTLEHLRDPLHELGLARELLAPGGAVAISCPNVAGLYPRVTYRLFARTLGVWEHPELPLHMYDFSPKTLERVLARAGLRVERLRTYPTPFDHFRATTLSPEGLGLPRGVSRAVRLTFEAVRVVVYPLARLVGRESSMIALARRD